VTEPFEPIKFPKIGGFLDKDDKIIEEMKEMVRADPKAQVRISEFKEGSK
jgi:hypothetical protein